MQPGRALRVGEDEEGEHSALEQRRVGPAAAVAEGVGVLVLLAVGDLAQQLQPDVGEDEVVVVLPAVAGDRACNHLDRVLPRLQVLIGDLDRGTLLDQVGEVDAVLAVDQHVVAVSRLDGVAAHVEAQPRRTDRPLARELLAVDRQARDAVVDGRGFGGDSHGALEPGAVSRGQQRLGPLRAARSYAAGLGRGRRRVPTRCQEGAAGQRGRHGRDPVAGSPVRRRSAGVESHGVRSFREARSDGLLAPRTGPEAGHGEPSRRRVNAETAAGDGPANVPVRPGSRCDGTGRRAADRAATAGGTPQRRTPRGPRCLPSTRVQVRRRPSVSSGRFLAP